MNKKPILVVMAAGMGSRYGGLKQMDPIGPNGELIIDFSLYDAKRAGFDTAVCIIKHAIEDDFKAAVVSLTAILNRDKRLALMVLVGLQARRKDPDSFDKNEIIVPGGMPWDNK